MQSQFSNENWQRIDRSKYPLKALDEAVINAMMASTRRTIKIHSATVRG